jgi:peroxiredoxin
MPHQPSRPLSRRASDGLLAASLVLLAATGCTTGGAPEGSSPPANPATPSAVASPPATARTGVPETLAFSAPTVGGGRFDGATLAGKPAVLWFWAAWCPRCRDKADDVTAVQADYAGKVTFVGVAGLGSGAQAMADFVAQYDLGRFPHLADDQGVVWRHFGVTEQEFFVILDPTGTVVHAGPLSAEDLRQRVAALAG